MLLFTLKNMGIGFLIFGVFILVIAALFKVINKYFEWKESRENKSVKATQDKEVPYQTNKLYKCECGKYSRHYQQELKMKDMELKGEKIKPSKRASRLASIDDLRKREFYRADMVRRSGKVCPHCSADKFDVLESSDNWPWLDTHPDCPKIDYEGYLQYQNTLKEVEQLIYDVKSIDAYKKYNGFK